ncbi:MAG TPA: hypothetical protein H9875_06915 [Candidatus Levilactobacillus faecigallinarum]|uniref:Uncharacterized protein n=1 Tax=Candidatus Levilactobacillus faecigallinarum TaxID=2838638 RepID=A0A9D1U4W6_9LACO|nr:hypothetical protein [Candidatus Levilactobacillus faecigallinarum]
MSRVKRIVRFTFWSNNFLLIVIAGFMLMSYVHLPSMVAPVCAIGLLVILVGMQWYLHNRLGVRSLKGLRWVDDERERGIALKVHSVVMMSAVYFLYGLLLVIFLLMNFELSAQALGRTLLGTV